MTPLVALTLIAPTFAWTLQAPATLPATPAAAPVYLFAAEPLLEIEDLQDAFGTTGALELWDDPTVESHVTDGVTHAWLFTSGGAAWHDLGVLESIEPIALAEEDDLWAASEALLEDLDLLQVGPFDLVPGDFGEARVTGGKNADGSAVHPWTFQQLTFHDVLVDGWPSFGGGSQVELSYGDDAMIGLFSHALRAVAEEQDAPMISARDALRSFERRARKSGRLNMEKAFMAEVRTVRVDDVTFGYWMPDLAQGDGATVPVWELSGKILGTDPSGRPTSVDLRWYEPAVTSWGIPSLGITPVIR